MAKLYPPYIEGTIPAFYTTDEGTFIKVPFSMNKTVSISEITGFTLKIKTLNGTLKGIVYSSGYDAISGMYVTFNITDNLDSTSSAKVHFDLTLGSYYKLQMAYLNEEDEEGYYSTVGVTKYTTKPKISIKNLDSGQLNAHCYDYTGVYSQQGGDATEKLYSSYFVITDNHNDIIEQSPEKMHDNTTDDLRYEATELYQYKKDFPKATAYFIQFFIKTTNLIELSSPKYRIVQQTFVAQEHEFDFKAALDFNNGCIELTMENYDKNYITGSFSIKRASSLNNWIYEEIQQIHLITVNPKTWKYIDYNIEHGATYRYSIQQFNSKGVYSGKIYTDEVYGDFEDSFLFDGERQLRIRFNPKISSFKTTIQEQKTETIGHQFPYFTRNSHIKYKEFPISGLISYLSDENEYFIKKDELSFHGISTDLTSENMTTERLFKMQVLDWLNNGKYKVFRSPAEGNFLVRLMSVSLSPNDTLGRMLHTFSCTAYEVGEYNVESLEAYKLTTVIHGEAERIMFESKNIFETIDEALREFKGGYNTVQEWQTAKSNGTVNYNTIIDNYIANKGEWFTLHDGTELTSIHLSGIKPGTEIKINGEEIIVIGSTCSFYFSVDPLIPTVPVTSLQYNLKFFRSNIEDSQHFEGLFEYEYKAKEKAMDTFQLVSSMAMEDVPCQQFIGTSYYKNIPQIDWQGNNIGSYTETNIINLLTNEREKISQINMLRLYKRPIIDGYLSRDFDLDTVLTMIQNREYSDLTVDVYPSDYNPMDNRYADTQKEYQLTCDQAYYYLASQINILPIYQLRMPRSDYREQWDYFNLQPDPNLRIYEYYDYSAYNYRAYTFEGYYQQYTEENGVIHQEINLQDFAPYIGYFFDPATGKIFKSSYNTFTGKINGTSIDVLDVETFNYHVDETTKINSIELKEGLCCDFGYFKSISYYIFDDTSSVYTDANTKTARTNYESVVRQYLIERDGYKTIGERLRGYINTMLKTSKSLGISENSVLNCWENTNASGSDQKTIQSSLKTYLQGEGVFDNYYNVLDKKGLSLGERDSTCHRAQIEEKKELYLKNLKQAIEKYWEENGT